MNTQNDNEIPSKVWTPKKFIPADRDAIRQITLFKTPKQIKRGLDVLNAFVDKAHHKIADDLDGWKLDYCYGWPSRPQFRAATKVNGKLVLMHRLVAANGDMKSIEGKFVIPADGDMLHCWFDNLLVLTKDERDARRIANAQKRGSLTDTQQALLDAEVERTGLSRWQVIGTMIERCLTPQEPHDASFD